MTRDLAALLHDEVDDLEPHPDSLHRLTARVVRRRRARAVAVPAALAAVGIAAAVLLLPGDGDRDALVAVQPTPTPTAGPGPTRTTTPPVVTSTPAMWPFTNDAQARAWQLDRSSLPWAADPRQVVARFLSDHLGIRGVTVGRPTLCDTCPLLLAVAGHPVGKAFTTVQGDPALEPRPFSVTRIDASGDLRVTSPTQGQRVASPQHVTGRITGVDENVRLRLVTFDGTELATAGAAAGSAIPWQADLRWVDRPWFTGALVATTYSAKDGTLNRLQVLLVRRN